MTIIDSVFDITVRLEIALGKTPESAFGLDLEFIVTVERFLKYVNFLKNNSTQVWNQFIHDHNIDGYLAYNIDENFNHIEVFRETDNSLEENTQKHRNEIPSPYHNKEQFKNWWKDRGIKWFNELIFLTIDSIKISENWRDIIRNKELIKQYYNANKLLVECLNSSAVSLDVRQEIEDTLFLSVNEIEKRRKKML